MTEQQANFQARMPFECAEHDWPHITADNAKCAACWAIANLHIMWKNNRVVLDIGACREAANA